MMSTDGSASRHGTRNSHDEVDTGRRQQRQQIVRIVRIVLIGHGVM
jgi:hypothetical protein